jgi:acyl dehydratase
VLLAEIAETLGLGGCAVTLRDAKFTRPVLPGDRLKIAASPVEGGMKFEASSLEGTLALSGTMLAGTTNHDR